jgi:hypothetical protein
MTGGHRGPAEHGYHRPMARQPTADRTSLLVKYEFERDGYADLPGMIAKGLIPADALIAGRS